MLARWLRIYGRRPCMPESPVPRKQPIRISRHLAFQVVVSSLALVTVYLLLRRNVAAYELWGSLAFGALVDQVGFPRADVFSFTAAGREWVDHSWGASVFLLRVLRDGGSSTLFALKVLLFVAALSTAARIYRAATAERETALADAVFFVAGLPCCYLLLHFYTPSIPTAAFSVLGFVASLWILDTYRRWPSTRAPWLLPPMFAVWVNLDSGFVFGFLALAVHLWWLARDDRKTQATELAIVTLFGILATLLNPYGWLYVRHLAEGWTFARTSLGVGGDVFSNGLVFAWTYAAIASSTISATAVNTLHGRRVPGELLLLVGTATLGWFNVELVPFFVVTTLALGIPEVLLLVEQYNVPQRVRDYVALVIPGGLAAAALVLTVLHVLSAESALRPQVPGWNGVTGQMDGDQPYPIGAATVLENHTTEVHLWAPMAWGEYLSWRLFPNTLVSIDGRNGSIYPGSVRDDYARFWGPARDLAAADKYDTTHILVPATNAAMIDALDQSKWQRAYEDPIAVLYSRDAPLTMPAARANDTTFVDDLIGDLGRFQTTRR